MDKHYKTVVEGEASESESEEETETTNNDSSSKSAVVVDGEASESDEEEIDTSAHPARKELQPLKVTEHSASFESVDDITGVPTLSPRPTWRPKYDTVLNRKLWESNLSLCNNLNGIVSQAYLGACKEISNCAQQLSRSQLTIQDVSYHMRLMTNDLFKIHDKIDIIATCKLLPNIQLPEKKQQAEEGASSSSQEQAEATAPSLPSSTAASGTEVANA